MDYIKLPINFAKESVNSAFVNKQPWQIVAITASSVLFSTWLYGFLFEEASPIEKTKKKFFRLIRYIPYVRNKVASEMKRIADDFDKQSYESTKHLKFLVDLPMKKKGHEEILTKLDEYLGMGEYKWREGRVSGAIYYSDAELVKLVKEVYGNAYYTNPLHIDVFPGMCKIEAEVLAMSANLFHGDEKCKGSMTTGGTESILMACKAYRDFAKDTRGISMPEIIVPVTAHSAFDKAAQYLKLRVRSIKVNPQTRTVDMKAMKRAINGNTIMLVGSAPNFPYGTIDDIAAISELGVKYNVPVHVDSCLGGFLTAFMDAAGYPTPPCDFRLPGVTSISADTHKYGYAPKGTSVILYRSIKYLHYQYTVTTDWPGGVYGSPTICGSRAGGVIAVCWATMLSIGFEGYVENTRNIIHTTRYIEKGLRRIKGIFIFGQPGTSVIAVGSNNFDIFRLQTALREMGWNLNPLQFPSGFHICITQVHTQEGVADKFIKDVQTGTAEILKSPVVPVEGKYAMYGAAQTLPDRSLVGDLTRLYLDQAYYVRRD